jgi:hypothetical protein
LFGAVCNSGCSITLPDIPDDPPIIKPEDVDPQPQPQVTNDVAGIPCAALPVTAQCCNVQHVKGKTTWQMCGTAGWPVKNVKVDVQGQTLLYVWRGGKWQGGKFDWFRPGQQTKGHENIDHNYMGIIPAKGDKVAFGLVDVRNAQRSNFVEGVWP